MQQEPNIINNDEHMEALYDAITNDEFEAFKTLINAKPALANKF